MADSPAFILQIQQTLSIFKYIGIIFRGGSVELWHFILHREREFKAIAQNMGLGFTANVGDLPNGLTILVSRAGCRYQAKIHQMELAKAYSQSDLYVVSSRIETVNVSMLQAMA